MAKIADTLEPGEENEDERMLEYVQMLWSNFAMMDYNEMVYFASACQISVNYVMSIPKMIKIMEADKGKPKE